MPEFSYRCRISRRDQVRRTDGVVLASIPNIKPQDVLLQDRLNFHKFGMRDDEDTDDYVYSRVDQRSFIAAYEDLTFVAQNPGIADLIFHGTPVLQVNVSRRFITVRVIASSEVQPLTPSIAIPSNLPPSFSPPPAPAWTSSSASQAQLATTFNGLAGFGFDFSGSRLVMGMGIVLLSVLVAGPVKKQLLGTGPAASKTLNNRFFRGMVFFVVSVVILLRSHAILAFLQVSNYAWYVPLILTVVSAAFVAFMPETVMFSIVTWPVIGLMILSALQQVIILSFFGALAVALFLAPYVMYLVLIWQPTIWFHDKWGATAASIYVLAWLTFFFITIRFFKQFSTDSAVNTWKHGSRLAEFLREHFSAWAVARLLAGTAHHLALLLGGNYLPFGRF